MERRDLLKDQIEQLGKVLGKILADFMGMADGGDVLEAENSCNQRVLDESGIDVEKMVSLSGQELLDYVNELELAPLHLEILSGYLKEIALADRKQAEARLKRAIELLDIADEISQTFSFERSAQKEELEHLLKQFD